MKSNKEVEMRDLVREVAWTSSGNARPLSRGELLIHDRLSGLTLAEAAEVIHSSTVFQRAPRGHRRGRVVETSDNVA